METEKSPVHNVQIQSLSAYLKTEPVINICGCCLAENNLRSMISTYYYEGKPENYSEMIAGCFALEMVAMDEYQERIYSICEACVSRLREAYFFKRQVEVAQDSIKKSLKVLQIKKESIQNDCDRVEYIDSIFDDDIPFDSNSVKSDSDDEKILSKLNKRLHVKKISSKRNKKKEKHSMQVKKIIRKKSKNSNDCFGQLATEIVNKKMKIKVSKSLPAEKVSKPKEEPYILDKEALTCEICNETFPLHSHLVRHMPVHFPNHICHICARVFSTKIKLKSHIFRHKEVPQSCHICNKSYKGSDNLKKHMKGHLGPNVLYRCPHCPERFTVYYRRMKHLVDVHNDEARKYKCKQCPKRYFQQCALSRHIRSVHLQERSCICHECGDAFFDKSGLTEHMLKHTKVKNFQCGICHKAYGRRFTLSEHMKIHNNDKRFICPVCGRAFTQKCTLKGHMKTHEKLPNTICQISDL